MTLRVQPEGLAAASAAVEALAARLSAVQAAAVPLVGAVLPPAADPVSLQTALALNAHGVQHTDVATQGLSELVRAGAGVSEAATSYVTGDAQAAQSFTARLPS